MSEGVNTIAPGRWTRRVRPSGLSGRPAEIVLPRIPGVARAVNRSPQRRGVRDSASAKAPAADESRRVSETAPGRWPQRLREVTSPQVARTTAPVIARAAVHESAAKAPPPGAWDRDTLRAPTGTHEGAPEGEARAMVRSAGVGLEQAAAMARIAGGVEVMRDRSRTRDERASDDGARRMRVEVFR